MQIKAVGAIGISFTQGNTGIQRLAHMGDLCSTSIPVHSNLVSGNHTGQFQDVGCIMGVAASINEIYSREQQHSDTDPDVYPEINKKNHTSSTEDSKHQNPEIMAHHPRLGSRPSVLLGKVEKQNLDDELELEQTVLQSNKKLSAVFKGFEKAEKYLENKGPQHFGPLYKLLHDNFVTVFTDFQKNDERTVMANKLARSQFIEAVIEYYDYILDELDIEAVQNAFIQELHGFDENPPSENIKEGYSLVLTIREILWNYSDSSYRFSETVSQSIMLKKLVHDLEVIFEEEFDDMNEPLEGLDLFAFNSAVGILHNCARNPNVDKSLFRNVNTIEVLTKYLQSSLVYVKMVTVLVLGNLVTENEVSKLATDNSVIDFLHQATIKAADHKDRKEGGFSLCELIEGLASMARSDENKTLIFEKQDIIALVTKMLTAKDTSDFETLACVKLLWELAFRDSIKKKIKANKVLVEIIKQLQDSKNAEVKNAARSAFFVLVGKDQRLDASVRETPGQSQKPPVPGVLAAAIKPSGKHIMISYCWNDKETVLKINHELVQRGFKIWIDVQEMNKYQNVLEGMARAVEEASIVLICYSEHYQNSRNCRTEAEYVYAKDKPFIPLKMQRGYMAEGWLGILVGVKLYIEFSPHYPFETKLEELSSRISKELGKEPTPQENVPVIKPTTKKTFKMWKNEDLQAWLKAHNMEGSSFKKVRALSGANLHYLHHVMSRAPETFYRWLETQLGLKTLDEFRTFEDALKEPLQ
ncbi:uncharacterized protein LOC127877442 isoform X3 [Dreissena polymorpha]|uniref:uncharacterized protein LOC127877442 isoform X2 n=1 Tax=Dreissena polymorpha TaxID=45954 RepID=UPI0022649C69|nr:uncharacterized protein LOC127877442 isoform X2 [Dreissena polymorpha]XP_052279284.1 uncharacterized protein LOC127877442 isoform X3 [Dreissena polymorpha]